MRVGQRTLVLVTVAAFGCYSPDYGEGDLRCGPAGECPPGFRCHEPTDRCYSADTAADASTALDGTATDALEGPCPPGSEGSTCGAGDVCNEAPTCVDGVCTANPKADDTVCAPTTDPCRLPGVCTGGTCGSIRNQDDGVPCELETDPCKDGSCASGECVVQGNKPDGHNFAAGYLNRCCGGEQVQINTPSNCGACGIECPSGHACHNQAGWPTEMWLCKCTASSTCWSDCCTNTDLVCAASDTCSSGDHCLACPGNASCTESPIHFYCHY